MFESHRSYRAIGFLLRASLAIATFVLAARTAHADEAARVRVRLHTRPRSDAGATYVEITVAGTDAPIRLVRRVAGACSVESTSEPASLVRVVCDGDVRFDVRRDSDAVLVRRSVNGAAIPSPSPSSRGDGDTRQDDWMVIARASLARRTPLEVDAPLP
jgi:hypothetical protein